MMDTSTFSFRCAFVLALFLFTSASADLFAQGQVTTNPPLVADNGSGGVTFNLNTTGPIVLDTVWCTFYGTTSMTVDLWYSPTAISGPPNITVGNGWQVAATATLTPINTAFAGSTIQAIPVAVNLPIPAGATYGFFVAGTGGSVAYTSYVNGNQISFTDGTVTVTNGPNIGYGGSVPNPTFNTRQFNGRVVYSTQIINQFPYCEGFENDEGGWNATGTSSTWEHGAPNNSFISGAAGGSNAWVTDLDGDHNNNEFSYIFSPEFDVSSLIDPMIRFQTIHELETGNDGVTFQYSDDSLNTWTTLGSNGSPAPWFNTATVPLLAFFSGASGWSGNETGWTDMIHSLSSIPVDTSLFFRFALASNGNNANEGFGFDDLIVAESNDISYEALLAPDSTCGESGTVIQAVFCNKSILPMTGFSIVLDTGGTNITVVYGDTLPVCGCDTTTLLTLNTSTGIDVDLDSWIQNTGDVNINNDSASASMLLYSIPSGTVIGGGSYCVGEIAPVTFILSGGQPYDMSFTNGTSPQFVNNLGSDTFMFDAITSGVYELIALTDSTGCSGDTGTFSGQAILIFNPAPLLELGNDTTVCGSVVLDAGPGLTTYDWSTGGTSQTENITQTGTYDVTVSDSNGCTSVDDIDIAVNVLPIVSMDDTVICDGNTFTFNAGAPYLAYLWQDGSSGQLFTVNSMTSVSVTVTDFNGCEGTTTASITAVVPNPTPSVTNASGLAPITLDAGAGFAAYDWVTNATTQTIEVFASGTYTVTVTDDNGCEGTAEGNAAIWPNGVEDVTLNAQGIAVFPNPAVDRVTIVVANDAISQVNIELIDLLGKQVAASSLSTSANARYEWAIPSDVSSGQYILRIRDAEGTIVGDERLIVR